MHLCHSYHLSYIHTWISLRFVFHSYDTVDVSIVWLSANQPPTREQNKWFSMSTRFSKTNEKKSGTAMNQMVTNCVRKRRNITKFGIWEKTFWALTSKRKWKTEKWIMFWIKSSIKLKIIYLLMKNMNWWQATCCYNCVKREKK